MLVGALAACGNVGGEKPLDATAPAADARAMCDPMGAFDPPVPLAGFNTAGNEEVPRFTADEREMYFDFSSNQGTPNRNIVRSERTTSSSNAPFGAPIALAGVNTTMTEAIPSISGDGLMLVFVSDRVSNEGFHLYVSTRTSRAGEFGAPSKLINVSSATATDSDNHPFLSMDGQELWFTSNRVDGLGALDIYRATWNGSSFSDVVAMLALSSSTDDFLPVLSADGLTVYLASNRPDGKGGFDIWMAHRSTTRDGFPAPRLVPELNTEADDRIGWISPDNCRIYLSSSRAGTADIYVANRHPM